MNTTEPEIHYAPGDPMMKNIKRGDENDIVNPVSGRPHQIMNFHTGVLDIEYLVIVRDTLTPERWGASANRGITSAAEHDGIDV